MNESRSFAKLEQELRALTDRALSPRARYLHVALLLSASAIAALLITLLVTESTIPPLTRHTFEVMLAIASCWVAYAIWVLRHRHPMLTDHRVVAGRMAVLFSALFSAGALSMALLRGQPVFWFAAATGALMCAVAVAVMLVAKRRAAELRAYRTSLEQMLKRRA